MDDSKRYDCYTRTDADDRMVGHFCCGEAPCGHCRAGVPFGWPPDALWPRLSERVLALLRARAEQQAVEARAVLTEISVERGRRRRDHDG